MLTSLFQLDAAGPGSIVVEMDHLTCDRCGAGLLLDAPVRYEVTIDVRAAYDPLELTAEDLARAESELKALVDALRDHPADKAQDEVHRRLAFDLCAACQKRFLANPLGRPAPPDSDQAGDLLT
jgi:hypothetical protein